MSFLLKLTIPVGLGLAAGAMNYAVVSAQVRPYPYVVVRKHLLPGEVLPAEALDRLEVPGDRERQKRTMVPFEEASTLVGTVCQRELRPGDVVLFQDVTPLEYVPKMGRDERALPVSLAGVTVEPTLLRPGLLVDFVVVPPRPRDGRIADDKDEPDASTAITTVGPFRILSIGRRVENKPTGDDAKQRGAPANERNILVPLKVLADGHLDENSTRLNEAVASGRIRNILLRPSKENRE
jgi:hypothetical protein